jgi:hypothetical protein
MARIPTPRRLVGALLALSLVGAACGGDDDVADDADDVRDQVEDALGGTLPGGEPLPDDVDDILVDVTIPDLDDLAGVSIPEMAAVGGGSCSVSLSGAYDAEWSEEQNSGSGLVTYWLSEEQKGILGDGLSIIANCTGDGDSSFSLLSSTEADESSIPMAPGTYDLEPAGALEASGPWSILMVVDGAEAIFGITEPGGTLEVTEFDDDTFSFVLDAPVVDTFASMTGGSEEPSELHVEYTLDKVDI